MEQENIELDRRRQDINEKINDLKGCLTAFTVKFAIIEYKTNQIMFLLAFLGTTTGALVISEIGNRLKPDKQSYNPVIQLVQDT